MIKYNSNELSLGLTGQELIQEKEIKTLLEQNHKYYLEYSKLCEANSILKNQLSLLLKEKNALKQTVHKIEVLIILILSQNTDSALKLKLMTHTRIEE